MINLRNCINGKEVPENENPKKTVSVVGKFFDFNKQQKGKGHKILTPKQILQKLLIAVARIKAGNTSENLLNKIKLYILCLEKKKLRKKYITI